jgi:uncharacterized protein YdbL (DUF1318 family)
MKGKLKATAALLAGLVLLAVFVRAESAELKARFLERKPLLEKMKAQGWIGENHLGFLAFHDKTATSAENAQLVKAENEYRGTVYAEIAVKVNVSAEEVGKRRAVQIAKLAAAGHWLQDAAGNWYQKE